MLFQISSPSGASPRRESRLSPAAQQPLCAFGAVGRPARWSGRSRAGDSAWVTVGEAQPGSLAGSEVHAWPLVGRNGEPLSVSENSAMRF